MKLLSRVVGVLLASGILLPLPTVARDDHVRQTRDDLVRQERDARVRQERENRIRQERYRSSLIGDPASLLLGVYANYIMLQRCYAVRQGQLAIFIDDAEFARATAEANALKERVAVLAPSVDAGLVWRRAQEQVAPFSQNMQNCRGALAFLDRTYGN